MLRHMRYRQCQGKPYIVDHHLLRLRLGGDVCHVFRAAKRFLKRWLGDDKGGQTHAFAYVGDGGQQEKVLGVHDGEVLKGRARTEQQRRRKPVALCRERGAAA